MGKLHIIDVSIVGIYLLLCLVIGLYKSTGIKTIKEYAIGKGNFPTFVIVA
ncbi:MAG: Na+/proline symporter, partial [Candidatus Midichloriaceae bacterium]